MICALSDVMVDAARGGLTPGTCDRGGLVSEPPNDTFPEGLKRVCVGVISTCSGIRPVLRLTTGNRRAGGSAFGTGAGDGDPM